jgi:pimeloyl-ACP methyl ester carboxylesterase
MRCALALLAATSAGACVVPNLVLPAGAGATSRAELHAPARAELIETAAADGSALRGVWVPGEPRAPVVLHLMESTVGATEAARTHGIYWDLPAAGYALLAFDYRGVAASGGARSTEHVRADARAMWREAVARAGGDEGRVALRGGSLGALAVATLLQDGARPGAVVLYGPVRSESVVRHFMVTGWAGTPRVPEALAPWLALLFRRPLAVDLVEELARCRAPLLVICGAHDELLPPEETRSLLAAVARAGGRFLVEELAHVELCTRHHRMHDEERDFLREVLPVTVDVGARERTMLDAMQALGAPELDESSRAQLRALLGRRIEAPPAVVAGLLAAGFDADRAARWLDADLAVRGRWLDGLAWGSVQSIAAVVGAGEDPLLFALVKRRWSDATLGASALLRDAEAAGLGPAAQLHRLVGAATAGRAEANLE